MVSVGANLPRIHSRAGYIAAALAAAGVPALWADDAAQDIAVACWLAGDSGPIVIRRRAIDAARRYGPRDRRGRPRLQTVSLDECRDASMDAYAVVDATIDFIQALGRLTPPQRRHLLQRADTDSKRTMRGQVRRRLRAMVALKGFGGETL